MINIVDKSKCCGCGACEQICPAECLSMEPDNEGFLYPKINKDLCISCDLCDEVCSFKPEYDTHLNLQKPDAYAARHKDITEINTSRSGAAFIALSDWILDNGGVVYGAGYIGHFKVIHKRAVNKEQRNEFKGSKYVQSEMNNIFFQVKKDLEDGLLVLFSGTPCQTSGLISFIGDILRKNLYVVDIVCHGVPSPYIWRDYLKYLEQKVGKVIKSLSFRDKQKFGWTAHRESFVFEDSSYLSTSTYTYIFYKHIMFRESCGVCHYTNLNRPSDITIADLWGWEKVVPDFNLDDKGCSLLLCNTEKGRLWLKNVSNEINLIPINIKDCMQPNLKQPSLIHPKRMQFEKDYVKKGIVYVLNKYGDIGYRYKLKIIKDRLVSLLRKVKRAVVK